MLTSSISTTTAPVSAPAARVAAKASRTLPWRRPAGRPVCVGVARTRRSAVATGIRICRARSAAWLNPRWRLRDGWSGTGIAQAAPSRMSAPRSRIIRPSGLASDRRPSYFKAWMIARSAPSYAPIALARSIRRGRRRQRAQHASGRLTIRHVGNGSPQRSQSGAVKGRIDPQQASQTGPRVGWRRSSPHAAQDGERTTERTASEEMRIAECKLLNRFAISTLQSALAR